MKNISTNAIALICLLSGLFLVAALFVASRNDPSLRIAALVAGTNYVALLGAVGSTILTGKDLSKPRDPADMPPNSTATDTSTVKVGPDPTQLNPK